MNYEDLNVDELIADVSKLLDDQPRKQKAETLARMEETEGRERSPAEQKAPKAPRKEKKTEKIFSQCSFFY